MTGEFQPLGCWTRLPRCSGRGYLAWLSWQIIEVGLLLLASINAMLGTLQRCLRHQGHQLSRIITIEIKVLLTHGSANLIYLYLLKGELIVPDFAT